MPLTREGGGGVGRGVMGGWFGLTGKSFQQLPRKQVVYTIMVVVLITGSSCYQNCPLSGITAISISFIDKSEIRLGCFFEGHHNNEQIV